MVNSSLASVIDGSGPGATPPADDFVERDWPDMVKTVPSATSPPRGSSLQRRPRSAAR